MIDSHHHLWDLSAVHYPWIEASGVTRFFGDPTPIQRNYLIDEFRRHASAEGFTGSVHIQVGATDGFAEANWVQQIADQTPDWQIAQVVFCDLTSPDLPAQLDAFEALTTVRGVRQIIGRAPGEDAATGTNDLLQSPAFLAGLVEVGRRGLSFDLQLIPELMAATADILESTPDTRVALCHAGSPHDRSSHGRTSQALIVCRQFVAMWIDFVNSGPSCLGPRWSDHVDCQHDTVRPLYWERTEEYLPLRSSIPG